MLIIGIDPGPKESSYVAWDGENVLDYGDRSNEQLIPFIRLYQDDLTLGSARIAIEQIRGFGVIGSNDLFDTVFWSGRFYEAWGPQNCILVPRKEASRHICGPESKGGDKFIREALIARIGPQGSKKAPGPTYGLAKHRWAALAVAVTARDRL